MHCQMVYLPLDALCGEGEARQKAHDVFGDQWFTSYKEADLTYFPRGVIDLERNDA